MADGLIVVMLEAFTEPFILPVRLLFKKLNLFQNSPIDFSGLVVMILISVITLFLL
jgi:ABC-type Na+ efflux pump permease subunit